MKQPRVHITDINGKDWGYAMVRAMYWGVHGRLWQIDVDFMRDDRQSKFMAMYDYGYSGKFVNTHGNLQGVLVYTKEEQTKTE